MRTPKTLHTLWVAVLVTASAAHAQWTTYAPMPTARWGIGCVAEGGRLYVISGNGATQNEVYNPGTNSWATLAPIPLSTAYPQMASWNGKIYVMGGANGSSWLANNQIYDIATNTWTSGAPMPAGRMGGTAVAYGGRIYVATGWNSVLLNTLHIYDIASNTWSSGANAPTARYQTRGGLIGDRMYIAGGYASSWVGTTESYHIASNTWSTHATMPGPRYIHAGGSDGAELYMAAGYNGGATNTFQSYNPSTNTWTIRPNAPTARYRVDGAVLNGCFYVAGGFNGSATVATLEGFCGLAILPSPAIQLEATLASSAIRLDWAVLQPIAPTTFHLERSLDGGAFLPIATLAGATTYLDPQPMAAWVAYRLSWQDQDGETHTSNVASLGLTAEPQPYFLYTTPQSHLQFIPTIPYPLDQGTATLHDASGRLLKREPVSGDVNWDLSGFPPGTYIFHWTGGAKTFARKVLR